MEAFGYQTTEGFGDKLKTGAKVVWEKIKAFFKAIGNYIAQFFKWVASKLSKGKIKKETSEIIEAAVSESKSSNEIVALVKTKVEEVVLERDKIYEETEKIEDNISSSDSNDKKPESEEEKRIRERHEAYDNIYNMYSSKLGDGSVGYSEAFTNFAKNKWAIEYFSGTHGRNIGKHDKSVSEMFDEFEKIRLMFEGYFTSKKSIDEKIDANKGFAPSYDERMSLNKFKSDLDSRINNNIECIKIITTRMDKIAKDRYNEVKKLYLHDISVPGGLEKELDVAKKLQKEYESFFNKMQPLTNEMMGPDISVTFSNFIAKVLTPLGKIFGDTVSSLTKIAQLVAMTDQAIAAILYGGNKSSDLKLDHSKSDDIDAPKLAIENE